MPQQPGEIAIEDRQTGEVYFGPPDMPYDRERYKLRAASGTVEAPLVIVERTPPTPEAPGVVDPLSPEFQRQFPVGAIPNTWAASQEPPPAGMLAASGRTVAQSVLPTAGAMLGRAAPIPGAPFTGEALGGMAGEGANQLLGITAPSATQIGLQGAAPFVGRAVGAGVHAVAPHLPGAQVARHEAAARTLEALPGRFAPQQSSAALAEVVQQFNPRIPTTNLRKAAQDLIAAEGKLPQGSRNTRALEIAEGLETYLSTRPRLEFQEFRSVLQRYGAMTGQAKRQGETLTSEAASKVYRAAQQDLDDTLGRMHVRVGPSGTTVVGEAESSQAAKALRAFNAAYRKERAAEELGEVMLNARVIRTRDDGLREIHPQRLLEAIRKDDFLAGSFSTQELAEIKATAEKLRGIPVLPPQAGQQYGSGRIAAGTGVGFMVGKGIEAVTGVDASWAMAVTAAAPAILGRALSTPQGRAYMTQLLQRSPSLDHNALATLAAFTASQAAAPGQGPQLIGPAGLR
jgi:hypothetical protein